MAKHLRITGLVQGVSYRASFQKQAQALGLAGWVCNRLDGSVEATVKGTPDAVQLIINWAGHGPTDARVEKVTVTDVEDALVTGEPFEIYSTQ